MTTLRWYQEAAVEETYEWMRKHPDGKPLIVLPTGAGKSIVLARVAGDVIDRWSGRILVVSHVREIVQQNAGAMRRFLGNVGVMCAGLNSFDCRADAISASVQTAKNRVYELGHRDVLLIDEAHLVPGRDDSMYQTMIAGLREVNPGMRVVGLTATPYRLDVGCLVSGKEKIFDAVSFEAPISRLVAEGFLCKLVPKHVNSVTDTSKVGMRAGEFKLDQLEESGLEVAAEAVKEIMDWSSGRRRWLVFGCGVAHSKAVAELIEQAGVPVRQIYDSTTPKERAATIKWHKDDGEDVRCVVNNTVLTTGFDNPDIDLIAVLRPTCSAGLWVQMAGRGFRVSPRKRDCLVLDFGGNTERHGPLDMIRAAGGAKGDGEAPVKTCPSCSSFVAIRATECPECGYQFPEPEIEPAPSHEAKASTAKLLSEDSTPEAKIVDGMEFAEHKPKSGREPCVRATLYHGLSWMPSGRTSFFFRPGSSEWQHRRWAQFWATMGGPGVAPTDNETAIEMGNALRIPYSIEITAGKFPDLIRANFDREQG